MHSITGRVAHWRLVLTPAWRFVFALPTAFFGTAVLYRDEFLPPETAAQWRVLALLPAWPWYWWAIGTLAIVIGLVLEGSYRVARQLPSLDPATQAVVAHTEELRLQREARERANDPFTVALEASRSAIRLRPEEPYNPVNHRVPLLSFLKEAEKEGWDISGKTTLQIMDLLEGLRQVALDGVVVFFGKRRHHATLMIREPLLEIVRKHWEEYEIPAPLTINAEDNSHTSTRRLGAENIYEGAFADLHLDGLAGRLWLQGPAKQLKGRRDELRGRGL